MARRLPRCVDVSTYHFFPDWMRQLPLLHGHGERLQDTILVYLFQLSMILWIFIFYVTDFHYSLLLVTDYIFWIFWILLLELQQWDLPLDDLTLCFCHGHHFRGTHILLFRFPPSVQLSSALARQPPCTSLLVGVGCILMGPEISFLWTVVGMWGI
jgi:hypothetical protein